MSDIIKPSSCINRVEVAGFGNYGCILAITTKDNITTAYKIQYVPGNDELNNNQRSKLIAIEFQILSILNNAIDNLLTPNLLRTIEIFSDSNKNRSVKLLLKLAEKCECLKDILKEYNQNKYTRGNFYFYRSEYAASGNLNQFLQKTTLSPQATKQISFQIAWTLAGLEQMYGFRHLDLYKNNIVFNPAKLNTNYIFERGSSRWSIKFDASFPYIPYLIDFSISQMDNDHFSKNIQKNYPQFFQEGFAGAQNIISPMFFFVDYIEFLKNIALYALTKPEIVKIRLEHNRVGYHSDMWAFGITLTEMALTGFKIFPPSLLSKHRDWKPNQPWNPNVEHLLYIGTHVNEKSTQAMKNIKVSFIAMFTENFSQIPSEKRNMYTKLYLEYLIGICLLNNSLGNGLLPSKNNNNDQDEIFIIINSEPYKILEKHKKDILLVGKLEDNLNIYDYVVKYLRETHGNNFIDLIKKLLAWTISERVTLDHKDNPTFHNRFMNLVIDHEYYDSLRIKENIYSETIFIIPESLPIKELPFRPLETDFRPINKPFNIKDVSATPDLLYEGYTNLKESSNLENETDIRNCID